MIKTPLMLVTMCLDVTVYPDKTPPCADGLIYMDDFNQMVIKPDVYEIKTGKIVGKVVHVFLDTLGRIMASCDINGPCTELRFWRIKDETKYEFFISAYNE